MGDQFLKEALNRRRMQMRGVAPDDLAAVASELPDSQLQAHLNKLSVAQARRKADTIRAIVAERTGVEYIELEDISAAYTGRLTVDTSQLHDNSIRYTSKHFHATAKTFSIVPPGVEYDMGFIQICESRTQIQAYTDDGLNTRWEILGGFPKSDSSSNENIPWYHVGVGYACTHHTARKAYQPRTQETFELDDNFTNIGSSARLPYTKRSRQASTPLKRISRKQMFRAWFAVKRKDSEVYRLLWEVTYGFDFQIDLSYVADRATAAITERTVNITTREPAPDDVLPQSALRGPTMNGLDRRNVYVGDTFKCSSTQPIVIT